MKSHAPIWNTEKPRDFRVAAEVVLPALPISSNFIFSNFHSLKPVAHRTTLLWQNRGTGDYEALRTVKSQHSRMDCQFPLPSFFSRVAIWISTLRRSVFLSSWRGRKVTMAPEQLHLTSPSHSYFRCCHLICGNVKHQTLFETRRSDTESTPCLVNFKLLSPEYFSISSLSLSHTSGQVTSIHLRSFCIFACVLNFTFVASITFVLSKSGRETEPGTNNGEIFSWWRRNTKLCLRMIGTSRWSWNAAMRNSKNVVDLYRRA